MKLIRDISVGDTYVESILITSDLHNDFAHLSGDDSPIHTSIEFAKRRIWSARNNLGNSQKSRIDEEPVGPSAWVLDKDKTTLI